MAECPVCLEPLAGELVLPCGHTGHPRCILSCFQDEPLPAWRCPVCRAGVDPGGIVASCDLPPEARGRGFFRLLPGPCSSSSSPEAAGCLARADLEAGTTAGSACSTSSSSSSPGSSSRNRSSSAAGEALRCSGDGSTTSPYAGAMAPGSAAAAAGRRTSSGGGRLAAIERFFRRATAALQEEESSSSGGGTGGCLSSGGGSGSGSGKGGGADCSKAPRPGAAAAWVLGAAERMLPEPALAAAAAALASLRLRQLLYPKEQGSLPVAAASWLAAVLLLAGGAALGAVLLGRYISLGLLALCRLNVWVASLVGLMLPQSQPGSAGRCPPLASEPPAWIVALICFAALLVVLEAARQRAPRGGLLSLALRVESHTPHALLSLYAVGFGLATAILLISLLLNLGTIIAAYTLSPTPDEPPLLIYLSNYYEGEVPPAGAGQDLAPSQVYAAVGAHP